MLGASNESYIFPGLTQASSQYTSDRTSPDNRNTSHDLLHSVLLECNGLNITPQRTGCQPASGWESIQRGSVADKPDVPERIDEPALTVSSPGHLMIPEVIQTTGCPGFQGALYEGIGIVAKHLYPECGRADLLWAAPAILPRLTQEERRPLDFQTDNRSQAPQDF